MKIAKEVIELLKDEIPEIEYNRYIKQLTYDSKKSNASTAVFYAPNALITNWIKNKYTKKLEHLFEIKGKKVNVEILDRNSVSKNKKTTKNNI